MQNSEDSLGLVMSADLQARQAGMDTAYYDTNSSEVHVLNATASAIFSHVTPDRSIKEIALNITLGFSEVGAAADVESDVVWLVQELKRRKMLVEPSKATEKQKKEAVLTEYSMSEVPCAYFRPVIATYSLEELREMYSSGRSGSVKFGDTWNPDIGTIA
ncbi:MAG: hypothetical protein CML60_08060 [Rhodobacteraceae bacterium]|nr:hypothetical protein [Paracoccaceae bacterium]